MKTFLTERHATAARTDPHLAPERPLIAISTGSMRANNTGSWRNMRPVYVPRQQAPCSGACPVGVDIPAFLHLVESGDYERAWLAVLQANPLPGTCGRVCYHPCEFACNRSIIDSVVANHALERFVADQNIGRGLPRIPVGTQRSERVAVVGSGPAGLACAYHLSRRGYPVTVFEAEAQAGGILRTGIPPYRLPREVLDKEVADILSLGVKLIPNTALGRNLDWQNLREFQAVFIATGAHRSRRLGIPGEQVSGVGSALGFLKQVNSGYPPDIGGRVVVVGGGNTAIDAARTALRLGSKVELLYRRTRGEMPAVPEEIDAAIHEGVRVQFLVAPVAVHGSDGRLQALEMQRMTLGEPDASGRRSPVPVPDSRFLVPADTVLTAIGEDPELGFAGEKVRRSASKIAVNEDQATGLENVYAGGDAASSPGGTVAYALRAGRRAAEVIARTFCGGEPAREPSRLIGPELVRPVYFQRGEQVVLPAREIRTLAGDFEEIHLGLEEGAAQQEAARCLRCGYCTSCNNCVVFCPDNAVQFSSASDTYVIDMQHCKGCGICVEECPRGTILMAEEGRM